MGAWTRGSSIVRHGFGLPAGEMSPPSGVQRRLPTTGLRLICLGLDPVTTGAQPLHLQGWVEM